jgi:hypothetical protein
MNKRLESLEQVFFPALEPQQNLYYRDETERCQRVQVLKLGGQREARFGNQKHQSADFVRLSDADTQIR